MGFSSDLGRMSASYSGAALKPWGFGLPCQGLLSILPQPEGWKREGTIEVIPVNQAAKAADSC
jgi:hypothetical protein